MNEIRENKLKELFSSLEKEEKIIIYAIGALDNAPVRSKIKLQKLLFLVSNVFREYEDLLEFEPHLFGPYSEIVNDILEDLIKMELVEKYGSSYKLTPLGNDLYTRIQPTKELESVIIDFKDFLNDLSENELLSFIYVTYPNYIGESAKWNELKKDRIRYAISLLKKQKISFSKASELAGLNSIEFDEQLKSRGIKWRV
ncbi:MAG TPA: UPF0175 family protein [Methanofastidiosum sp.]|nr:UPF0175 family protein [Methanofastidiosum sp.]HNU61538.1 UPF0175 family protein [Methanofastidiosum sp.]